MGGVERFGPLAWNVGMITYLNLLRTPPAFKNLCGLSVQEFDTLCRELVYAHTFARSEATMTRGNPDPRNHAVGAGRKWRLDSPTRLLAALVWPRLYPT